MLLLPEQEALGIAHIAVAVVLLPFIHLIELIHVFLIGGAVLI